MGPVSLACCFKTSNETSHQDFIFADQHGTPESSDSRSKPVLSSAEPGMLSSIDLKRNTS